MSAIEAALSAWLAVAIAAVSSHGVCIYLLLRLHRKKVSDYLFMLLSIVEMVKVLLRVGYVIYCLTQHTCPRNNVYFAATVTCLIAQYLSVIFITLDRVLKVQLSIKYGVFVTKKSLFWVSPPFIVVCLCHGLVTWIYPDTANNIVLAWEIFASVIIIACYFYIFKYLRTLTREIFQESSAISRRPGLKLKVPLLIVATFLAFCVFPNLLLAARLIRFSPWLYIIFDLNTLCDVVIYVFGTPKLIQLLPCHASGFIQEHRNIDITYTENTM